MERASRVPRLYESAAMPQRQISPPLTRPSVEGWATHPRTSPYPSQHAMPPMPPAPAMEMSERLEHRPAMPSLPPVATFDHRDAAMHAQRQRGHSSEDFQQARPAPMGPMADSGPSYRAAGGGGYPYGYHHPSRHQSLSLGSIQPFDRTPFSAGGYAPQYQEYMRIGELGAMSMHGDSKQRKRRGNLPKETTDKLRAWFVAHLQHPYPTEDEKQDLMRQTGLQMSKSSSPSKTPSPPPSPDACRGPGCEPLGGRRAVLHGYFHSQGTGFPDVGNLNPFVGAVVRHGPSRQASPQL